MRKIYLLSTFVLTLLFSKHLYAQDFSNKGKEFWFCFPNHIPSGANGSMSLWITSDKATSGTITMSNGTFNATFSIAANGIQSINIPYNLAHISNAESGLVIQKSIKVKADPGKPAFVAYAQQYGNARSAATLLLPTSVLGKKYRAISFTHTATSSGGQNSRSQFQVIAIKPNTLVNVVPFANGVAGTPFMIPLPNVGDMYQYQATSDVTGTLIESVAGSGSSCSPIAVFSGNSAVTIGTSSPNCNGSSYDPLFQQNYPISTWGKNFGFIPFGDYNGNPYRVMASEDNTTVFFNGAVVATLNAGQIYPAAFTSNPVLLTTATSITADKPVCVTQYAQTSACSGSNNGDPDMVILNPIEQNIKDITIFSSTQQNINRQWLNVLIKTIAVPSFTIDGVAPTTPFQAAPNIPGYSYLKHQFTPAIQGSHFLKADSGFNAICYGFQQSNFESYAYSAGTNVKDLYQQIGVSTQYGIEPTPSVCKGSPFKFKVSLPYCVDSIQWDLSGLPGPPVQPPTIIYANCSAADSSTIVNGVPIYWYSLPSVYTFNTSGSFPVTITTFAPNTDGCGREQDIDFDLNVFDPPIADFVIQPGGCLLEAVKFFDNTETPRPTYLWSWDFGDPASGAANTSTLKNPTHIFSAPGTYNVTFSTITTPGCVSSQIVKQVVIAPLPTATIAGAITVCINDPEPSITFTAAGGTPTYTFKYHINSGPTQTIQTTGNATSVTIPVPTTVAGTFRYYLEEVTNTGSTLCVTPYANTFVDVVVNANTGLALTSGSNNQSVCQNIAIANIDYTISGGGNNATVTGLPPGVNGVYNAGPGIFTISGTPTTPGTYNYSVTATGLCLPNTLDGTITVNPDASITLTSGTNTQTVCINTSIGAIDYQVTGGGIGATVTGLPAGLTGNFSGGFFTISGSPTVSGTFNYTVTTTGTCLQKTATGTFTVTADATLSLTSAAPTTAQTVCINHAVNNITYQWGGSGTNATVSGLPTGVTYAVVGNVVTISGTPTVSGVFPYTVQSDGPCVKPALNGTITITSESMLTLSSAPATETQELCVNSPITDIKYSTVGSATGITVTGLPAGVTGVFSGGVFTISGTPTVSGVFNYTVTPTGPCVETNTDAGVITVNALPVATFTFTAPSCETRLITFTNTSTPNAAGTTIWDWNFGDPGSGAANLSSLFSPTHTYAAASGTPYTVVLTVTNSKGCISNPAASVPVTINNRPQAGFMVPEVCINDAATVFTDTSKILAGTLDPAGYEWDFGDPASGAANTSTTKNGSHLYTAIGLYTVRHIATSVLGCKDTVYNNIFINAADPVSDYNISNLAGLCSNDSVSLVNRSTIGQGSVTKLEIYWDAVGAPGVFDVIDIPVFNGVYKHKYPTLQTTQNYTIRMVAYSGAICFTNKTVIITVNAAPKVQFNAMPNVCLDAAPFQITQASETGGVAGPPGVFTGTGVSASGLFNPAVAGPGTHIIKFTFTSNFGCVDSLSKPITVLDSASAQFTSSALNCQNSPVSFNSSTSTIPVASGTITGWTWDFGDPASGAANTSTAANPTHTFSGWGTYNVKLYVTTSNGCRSTNRTMAVFVNPIPRPRFSFPASSCLPSASIVFNSSPSTIADGTQGSFGYLWNFGDPGSGALNSSTNSSPTHIYNTAGPFNVNLQITSGAGCVHDTVIVLNTIHAQPKGSFTSDKTEICVGAGTFTFTDNSDPMDGTTQQWNWNMDDGSSPKTTSVVANYVFSTPKIYNVSLYTTNSFGCRSTTFTLPITVHPYPVVDAGPDRIVLEGGQISLEPVVTGNDLTYLWTPALPGYFAGSNAVQNPFINGINDITLTLTVTGRGGCKDDDQVFIKVLKFPSIPNIFSPNGDGVHDKWEINYLNTYPGSTVDIYNRYGQPIFHSDGYTVPWDGTVNGKPVPVGTYYYIVNPKNGRKIMSGYVDVIR